MNQTIPRITRRSFVKSSAAFGAITILPSYIALGSKSSTGIAPSEKVNLAVIGVGNRGNSNWKAAMQTGLCNVVALCDIDLDGKHSQEALIRFGVIPPIPQKNDNLQKVYPNHKARTFTDFRKMFDEMGNEIDAILVSTPDHAHFAVTMLAMSLGKHVYVEKPLAHTFGQCERLIQMAVKNPHLATQMGNQGHSGGNYFQFKAWREAGVIKDVTRITAHMNNKRRWHGWGQSVTEYPSDSKPSDIDWNQWYDVVSAERPFSRKLHPKNWRSWFEYGSGAFGDWGPHILDTCHRFLELGMPQTITAVKREGTNDLVYPQASTIDFSFAARGPDLPACKVTWYDGTQNKPNLEAKYTGDGKPEVVGNPGKIIYGKDLVFKGGSHADVLQIVPRQKFMDMRKSLPAFSQKNSNHYENFLLACKGEEETRSPFSVSGPLTQVFNLGVIAQRIGGEIAFDAAEKKITNSAVGNALLDPAPRVGWEEFYTMHT
ncbi:MAG: Gfo/Idh/MocA family oxidoreductase [Verrucomicrobiota bacterium]